MSEVYRSAYLRALGWALYKGSMPRDLVEVYAAETCPVDLGLWRVETGRSPEFWPTPEKATGEIDTTAGCLTSLLAELWMTQSSRDWVLAAGGGRVYEGDNCAYDIDIAGVIQACQGSAVPDLEDAVDWDGRKRVVPVVHDLLAFEGIYPAEGPEAYQRQVADWRIWPLAVPGKMYTVPRWQCWRLYRDVWLPAPFLSRDDFSFRSTPDALVVSTAARDVGKWQDWGHRLREKLLANLSPSTGQMLLLRRSLVEDAASRFGGSFAWICRIRSYYRRHGIGEFEVQNLYADYGTTRVVR